MSIDVSALPRRGGVVEGKWAVLTRSPLNHAVKGAVFVGGMMVEPVEGAALERVLYLLGPEVLFAVRIDEDARGLVCVPPFDEVHAEVLRVLEERRVGYALAEPWAALVRMHDEARRRELEERFARAEEAIREIAKGHARDYESANAEAAVVFEAFSDRSMLRERLEATYAEVVALLEREAAEREAHDLNCDEPGPVEPGTIDNPEAAAAAAAGTIVPLSPEVPEPAPTVDDEAPKKGRKRKS